MAQNFQENVWSQYKCKAYKQYMYSIISIELCWNVTLCAPTSRNYPITHLWLPQVGILTLLHQTAECDMAKSNCNWFCKQILWEMGSGTDIVGFLIESVLYVVLFFCHALSNLDDYKGCMHIIHSVNFLCEL